jgi:CheY-like chemotaxis protein
MILFVDDEQRELDSHRLELEMSDHSVIFKSDVDKALEFLEKNPDQVRLLILDIMMPVGESFKDARHDGLRTGIDFYDRIRARLPKLPVIVFTHVADESVREKFNNELNCWFYRKEDVLPHELAERVNDILEKQ